MTHEKWTLFFILSALLCGCLGAPQYPAATQPSTMVSATQAEPSYWLNQPAVASASSLDFDKLWKACADTARDYQFTLDREDSRSGILTTRPLVSKQFFEVWRKDSGTLFDDAENSVQTIRRTIRFEIIRTDAGLFVASPKVLVERVSQAEHRITTVSQYRYVLVANAPLIGQSEVYIDRDPNLPAHYWYAIGRDKEMEQDLADQVKDRLRD